MLKKVLIFEFIVGLNFCYVSMSMIGEGASRCRTRNASLRARRARLLVNPIDTFFFNRTNTYVQLNTRHF